MLVRRRAADGGIVWSDSAPPAPSPVSSPTALPLNGLPATRLVACTVSFGLLSAGMGGRARCIAAVRSGKDGNDEERDIEFTPVIVPTG